MLIQINRDDTGLHYLGGFNSIGEPILVSKDDAIDYLETYPVLENIRNYYKQYPALLVEVREIRSNPYIEVMSNLYFQNKNWIEGVNSNYFNEQINVFIEPNRCYLVSIKLERL